MVVLKERILNYNYLIPQGELISNHQNMQTFENASPVELAGDHFLFLRVHLAGILPFKPN